MTKNKDWHNHAGYRAIFNSALSGICANPEFFGPIMQQSPVAAVEFAERVLDAALVLTGEASMPAGETIDDVRAQKDGAYLERNQVVAGLAALALRCGYCAGRAKTAIEGWSQDWHGCVYIDLPTGQVSWHYHDSHVELFAFLPEYRGTWDGHDTPEKYRRVLALRHSPAHPAGGEVEFDENQATSMFGMIAGSEATRETVLAYTKWVLATFKPAPARDDERERLRDAVIQAARGLWNTPAIEDDRERARLITAYDDITDYESRADGAGT